MLYKNNELYRLTAAEIGELKRRYPKFPVRLTYPASRIKPSRSKHNKLPDKPNSISFPFSATVKTKSGGEVWRYAENRIIGANNTIIWSPHNLILRGTRYIFAEDIELLYWLVKCCPFLEGGDNYNGKVPKCAIEDLIGEAERKAQREEQLATVKALIYSSKVGLGEERLRKVAKAYFISGTDELTFAQVKLAVEATIAKNKRTGIIEFLELVEADQTLEVKGDLQRAIDDKLIKFIYPKKTWVWLTEEGQKNVPICQIGAVQDPNEALYDYYLGNPQFAKELEAALMGSKVVE